MKFISVIFLVLALTNPVFGDSFVFDTDPPNSDDNPQNLGNSGEPTETAWLQGLLGSTIPVYFISKDDDGTPTDNVPANWTYAILKYGVGQGSNDNPTHWAIWDDNTNDRIDWTDLDGEGGIPTQGLSHISYYSTTPVTTPVPEPATMLLLGFGLMGLTMIGRRLH